MYKIATCSIQNTTAYVRKPHLLVIYLYYEFSDWKCEIYDENKFKPLLIFSKKKEKEKKGVGL